MISIKVFFFSFFTSLYDFSINFRIQLRVIQLMGILRLYLQQCQISQKVKNLLDEYHFILV